MRHAARWRVLSLVESTVSAALLAVLLFGVAGTTGWNGAWVWLALLVAASVVLSLVLDPRILRERVSAPARRRLRAWDAVWATAMGVSFFGWLVLMALDAGRFGWTAPPAWARVVGAVVVVAVYVASYFALQANVFASPIVDIQRDTHQTVVSTGPYGIVRHPLYAAVIWAWPATALVLGSVVGLALSPVLIALVVVRTVLEDRTLAIELDGYREYRARVRYRLIPRVW
ncbi:MAG TPA: isoprenylcysteine carboxylmethyltransferase family protein [Acidimicrobiales bacterium]|nr:isoprenylcysteine carboxylmethyltransferase family protein [Acidimicrobiales bacterium]